MLWFGFSVAATLRGLRRVFADWFLFFAEEGSRAQGSLVAVLYQISESFPKLTIERTEGQFQGRIGVALALPWPPVD
uniref:Putative secreted protein n=1 Tax=Anopheles marajoara TaxID=58244 RepID=A0A2M4CCM1_9DIPT